MPRSAGTPPAWATRSRATPPSGSASCRGDGILVDAVPGVVILGDTVVGNFTNGVDLEGATGVMIGGPLAGSGNLISGNRATGINIDAMTAPGQVSGATIQGNIVGLDATGSVAARFNPTVGILVEGSGNTIGGTASGAGNVVSGNMQEGILVQAIDASGHATAAGGANLIEGNLIGTDAAGAKAVGTVRSASSRPAAVRSGARPPGPATWSRAIP